MMEQVKLLSEKCTFCNHTKRIAVNGQQLLKHLEEEHSVNLLRTVAAELKASLSETWMTSADGDRFYECLHCIKTFCFHSELCLHNRKHHQKTVWCIMCKRTFKNFVELTCHLCSGTYLAEDTSTTMYRCCLCGPTTSARGLSAFRLMVHLRRCHVTCDVCLQKAEDQQDLANHIRTHKLLHLCYHCGITYRKKNDMKEHMFWKHGTESILCKRCLQRKWPHQYHFCVPPKVFQCDKCDASFAKAMALRVHTRIHDLNYPHSCKECAGMFITKKLLFKHQILHKQNDDVPGSEGDKNRCPAAPLVKMGKSRRRSLEVVKQMTSSPSDTSSASSSCSCISDSEHSTESSNSSPAKIKNASHSEVQTLVGEEGVLTLECGNSAKKSSITESDLETDESESDEDFYEEFPEQEGIKLLAEENQVTAMSQVEGKDQSGQNMPVVPQKRATTSLMVDKDPEDPDKTSHQKMVAESDESACRRYSKRRRVSKMYSFDWCCGKNLKTGTRRKLVIKRRTQAGEPCPLDTDTGKAQSDMAVGQKTLNNSKLLGGSVRKKSRTEPQVDNSQHLYCYCQKTYDPKSRMIGCDGKNCKLEWFHFNCVNIFTAPKGKWYCPDCKPRYKISECNK